MFNNPKCKIMYESIINTSDYYQTSAVVNTIINLHPTIYRQELYYDPLAFNLDE